MFLKIIVNFAVFIMEWNWNGILVSGFNSRLKARLRHVLLLQTIKIVPFPKGEVSLYGS